MYVVGSPFARVAAAATAREDPLGDEVLEDIGDSLDRGEDPRRRSSLDGDVVDDDVNKALGETRRRCGGNEDVRSKGFSKGRNSGHGFAVAAAVDDGVAFATMDALASAIVCCCCCCSTWIVTRFPLFFLFPSPRLVRRSQTEAEGEMDAEADADADVKLDADLRISSTCSTSSSIDSFRRLIKSLSLPSPPLIRLPPLPPPRFPSQTPTTTPRRRLGGLRWWRRGEEEEEAAGGGGGGGAEVVARHDVEEGAWAPTVAEEAEEEEELGDEECFIGNEDFSTRKERWRSLEEGETVELSKVT